MTQEDLLKGTAEKNNWHWIVTRPSAIVGFSKVRLLYRGCSLSIRVADLQGNFMSIAVTIALYAAAQKHLNQPLYYPGTAASWNLRYAHSTASNNAAFQVFAAENEKAWDKAFNIDDGEEMKFSDLWKKVSE